MKKLYLIFACVIISLTTMAQPGTLMWAKCFGGSGADSARSVANTTDGGYYVAGVTYSNDGQVTGNHNPSGNYSDVWVIKVDANGTMVWEKTYGGSYQDEANSVYATSDGGAIIAGWTNSDDGDIDSLHGSAGGAADFWIIKIDDSGNLQWQETLGGSQNDYGQSVQQTADGGYIVTGSTYSNDGDVSGNHGSGTADFWVVKLSSTGGLQWQNCYGGSLNDYAYSIIQTSDGEYVATGQTFSSDGNVSPSAPPTLPSTNAGDVWLLKLSSTGAFVWQNCFGGGYPSGGYSVAEVMDEDLFVSGYTYAEDYEVTMNYGGNTGATSDDWMINASSSGALDQGNSYGGSLNEIGRGVRQLRDGHVVVTGSTTSDNGLVTGNHGTGTADFWTYEMNYYGYTLPLSGNALYSAFGGSGDDEGYDVTETTDSNFVEVGFTNSTDGQVTGNNGSYDFWVIKVQSQEGAASGAGIANISANSNSLSVYPNPANDYTTVSVSNDLVGSYLELTDAVGRSVFYQQITNSKFNLKTSGLAKGVYLVKVTESSNTALVQKLIVE